MSGIKRYEFNRDSDPTGCEVEYRMDYDPKGRFVTFEDHEKVVKHWKSNHDEFVRRCALLRERPDLPVDRIPAYQELIRLQELVRSLGGQP